MIQRCENPNHRAFHNYGGRGIKICPEWRNSFEQFFLDMGPRPPNASIDRIDVDGDYKPSNCRWASEGEQKNNRRDNRLVEWEGETVTLSTLAARFGLTYNILNKRLKAGTPLEEALRRPVRITARHH